MEIFCKLVAFASLFALIYIYLGYLYLLKFLRLFRSGFANKEHIESKKLFTVTVLLTVRNEEAEIRERIENILEQNYPIGMLDILVASDGSTDLTNQIVSDLDNPRVNLFVSDLGQGKTATQNEAMKLIRSEVVVFTDVGTRFDKNFVRNISFFYV